MHKPQLLVTDFLFEPLLAQLRKCFEVSDNQTGAVWNAQQWQQRLAHADAVLCMPSRSLLAEHIAAAPQLKMVANMAVGTNNLDLAALRQRRIAVSYTPDVLTETTADAAFGLVLAAARRFGEGERFLRSQAWQAWRCDMLLGREVHGSTLGIWGMGRIGLAVARRAALGFGLRVLYHNRKPLQKTQDHADLGFAVHWCSLPDLLRQSDHLLLLLPYSADNHHCLGAGELAQLPPGATVVNVGRGGLLDESALCDALESGHIGAAGLDVFENEPQIYPRLLEQKNVVLTPHIASASWPTRMRMGQLAVDNLMAYFAGGRVLTPVPA